MLLTLIIARLVTCRVFFINLSRLCLVLSSLRISTETVVYKILLITLFLRRQIDPSFSQFLFALMKILGHSLIKLSVSFNRESHKHDCNLNNLVT